ncbi:TetR/AcrR family transcriptional regulator [Novosphingobium sp. CF614]|uniref:TetR/AcrR family transcriptional regulator n=1 Tax=Novosphingobium sp. CF614 TaxID=1884364 RepID=UPI002101AFEC|nr:TetR/AcrR family transcriptional regulator [Novosphingobium sp. CF614]
MIKPPVRRRNSAEDTRRKVLDVVLQTVIEIGYYKASSNEIARRAGVTWGTIQHLFGSRDQLMLDVVNYVAGKMEASVGAARVDGGTLEERLENILDVLAETYEGDVYLVQMQILLELSANPRMSALAERVIDRENGGTFDRLAQPLVAKAIGDVAADPDLVYYVFLALRGFLISSAFTRRIAKLPEGALNKPMGRTGVHAAAVQRRLLIQGVAATIRAEAQKRGMKVT